MRKVFVMLAMIYLYGCAMAPVPNQSEQAFQNAAISLKDNKYSEAIAVYRKIVAEDPGSELAADASFELALVLIAQDNPQNDLIKAISEFEIFLKRYPNNKRSYDAQIWISALKAILELKKENEHLKKNIDQLKRLDIRHEERRNTR